MFNSTWWLALTTVFEVVPRNSSSLLDFAVSDKKIIVWNTVWGLTQEIVRR